MQLNQVRSTKTGQPPHPLTWTREAGFVPARAGSPVQTDYNNDGHLDISSRAGPGCPDLPMRPSLLRNNGNGTFTDVTGRPACSAPLNSNSAAWADFDNDGYPRPVRVLRAPA